VKLLRPQGERLADPLAEVFRSKDRPDEAHAAAGILADYLADQPAQLVNLLLDADEKQFAMLYPRLQDRRDQALPLLCAELALQPNPQWLDHRKEHLAKRQANAAVAVLRLGQPDKVWPLLQYHPDPSEPRTQDPRLRSYLIHSFSRLGADLQTMVSRLNTETDPTARRALLLSLGEFSPDVFPHARPTYLVLQSHGAQALPSTGVPLGWLVQQGAAFGVMGARSFSPQFPAADRGPLVPELMQEYQDNPDPGLHGAAEWLLRQWHQVPSLRRIDAEGAKPEHRKAKLTRIYQELARENGRGDGYWYVNGVGQTMVVIPGPVQFLMGSPDSEDGRQASGSGGMDETQHTAKIGHSYAIAAKEVTVEQFQRCPLFEAHSYSRVYSPAADCPMNSVTWFQAAQYCNWLSKEEGIPEDQWCYEPDRESKHGMWMKLKPDYLNLTGYRLPTEAEWECACRAGAATSRFYGETEELLGKYAWYTKVSQDRMMLPGTPGQWAVTGGRLKPNDLGLFDMLGNALEWCENSEDDKDNKSVEDRKMRRGSSVGPPLLSGGYLRLKHSNRKLRGGSFIGPPGYVRCASRYETEPGDHDPIVGFRPARTLR
jgi:formylglycine-generating enzyme required for sulfatase activity